MLLHSGHSPEPANLRTHDSTPETLMSEGNKSRVSGVGVELNYTVHQIRPYTKYESSPRYNGGVTSTFAALSFTGLSGQFSSSLGPFQGAGPPPLH